MQSHLSLAMIAAEVERSLTAAASALDPQGETTLSADELGQARAAVEQVRGALQVADVAGAPRVLVEVEGLLAESSGNGGLSPDDPKLAAIRDKAPRALDAVRSYVNGLAQGSTPQPLVLAGVLNELLAARGSDRPAELELFDTDLARPMTSQAPAFDNAEKSAAETESLRECRTRFQRGLLDWLRGDAASLRLMREAVARARSEAVEMAPWWVAGAFIDHLDSGMIAASIHVKRIFAGLDKYFARLCAGHGDAPQPLMREMLYYIGQGEAASALVSEVREHYRLMTGENAENPAPFLPDPQTVAAVQELQALWEKTVEGDAAAAEVFASQLQAVSDRLPKVLMPLIETVRRAADVQAESHGAHHSLALEVATALLVIGQVTETTSDAPGWQNRVMAMTERLQQALDDGGAAAPGSIRISGTSHERSLLNTLGGELVNAFSVAEQRLSDYFTAHGDADAIDAVQQALQQAHGALQVLGDRHAAAAVAYCISETQRLGDSLLASEQPVSTALAAVISALSFYASRLGRPDVELSDILRKAGAPQNLIDAPAEAMDAPLPEIDADSCYEVGLASDAVSADDAETLHGTFPFDVPESLLETGPAAADNEIAGDRAADAPPVGGIGESGAMDAAAGVAGANPDSEVDVPSDAELLSVFVDEADEVLGQLDETVGQLRANRSDGEALLTLRRAFHTLKGSGRMVELWHFAEICYALEKLLDAHVAREASADDELVRLLDAVVVRMGTWIDALRNDARVRIDASDLKRWVDLVAHAIGEGDVASLSQTLPGEETPTINIGDTRLSRTLFEVFLSEAGRATKALAAEVVRIDEAYDQAKAYERFRLAHTLSGIAGTAGFVPLRELAGALEVVLRDAHEHRTQFGAGERDSLFKPVVSALATMLEQLKSLQPPTAHPELVASLETLAAPSSEHPSCAEAANESVTGQDNASPQTSPHEPVLAQEIAPVSLPRPVEPSGDTAVIEENAPPRPERRPQQRMEDDLDPALLPTFLEEAAELVPQIGEALRGWRADPQQQDRYEALTRLLHTFKGSARMAGAMALGELTHSMEARIAAAAELPAVPETLFEGLDISFDRMGVLLERVSKPAEPAVDAEASPSRQSLRVRVDLLEKLATQAGELATSRSGAEGQVNAMRSTVREMGSRIERLRMQVRELEIQAESQIQSRQVRADEPDAGLDPLELDRFTRLQELTRLIEESANDVTLLQQSIARHIDGCGGALAAQERMTRVLQDSLVSVRMIPFASLNERLHRVVRLTARDAGRRASLDIRGSGADLDRGVVERIGSPLEHLLRNAVVHGIEPPQVRRAAGKPETGEIILDVSQEGNEVVLVLRDDGRGLDLERLRARAVKAGRLAANATPTPEEIAQLAFEPGVSTAEEVSRSAGRGVGLDVVRNEVAAVGGRIELSFEPDRGTVFTVRLPLTMTVMQVLVMRCAGQLFALPAMMVEQVRTLKPEALDAVRRSGELEWQANRYPLYDLSELLALVKQPAEPQPFTPLVLVRGGAQRAAIQIDELVAHEEVVIKELGAQLSDIIGMVGAAVRGSGEIVLILNPVRLAQQRSQSLSGAQQHPAAMPEEMPAMKILIVDDSLTVRKITGRVLTRNGYRVLEARDGMEALETLEKERPQLVLLDAEMPRMDGFEVLRRLRSDPLWQGLPVMMITSRTAEKHRSHAMELGASAFLGKPFEEQQLLAEIANLIEREPA